MKKLLITLLILLISTNAYAGTISRHTTYATTSTVTSTNLNGNFDNIVNECDGGLDNDNADTTNGLRFYEVLGSTPAAATEGRMVYNTATDVLAVDDGTSFNTIGPGALKALSNLASVSINTSLVSDTDDTDSLGSTTVRWNTVYATTLYIGRDSTEDAFINGDQNIYLNIDADNDQTGAVFQVGTNRVLGTGGTALMTVDDGGDLGVGDVNPAYDIVTAGGICIGSDADSNALIDDDTHGSGATTLYIGNDTIAFSFTGRHHYQLGDTNLKTGECVRLENGKIYRTTASQDNTAIGIFHGITSWTDSLGNELIETKEETIDGKKQKVNKPAKKGKKNQDAVLTDFAYSVAVLGDSYEYHNSIVLEGAYVTIDAGVISNGDFLCSSSKAGYLEKQPDDIRHSYTIGIAREDITKDTKTAYIYLLQ